MMGKSSRFFNAGYTVPKYRLEINGKSLFEHVVGSFSEYFITDIFLFICRSDFDDKEFIVQSLNDLGVINYDIITLNHDTRGQADTVFLAVNELNDNEELFIFNIDTILYQFQKYADRNNYSGYLEVFKGEGDHWSFVLPSQENSMLAQKVTEKDRVSDLCSNGLYFFKSIKDFKFSFNFYIDHIWDGATEIYVAPLYNILISNFGNVLYRIVDKDSIGFCGTPDEYLSLTNS